MSGRVPVVATAVVAVAVAIMVMLGLWQVERARWKDALVERYGNAASLPPIAFPENPDARDLPLFRWATTYCDRPVAHRATAGANREGEPGYVHIVRCAGRPQAPGIAVELGWSKDPQAKFDWPGGPVTGMIAPDSEQRIRLVAASAPAGLQPSAYPSVETIPRNHRMYAATWFAFAAIALLVYGLALRRRWRTQ